jgi:hypothetical protein
MRLSNRVAADFASGCSWSSSCGFSCSSISFAYFLFFKFNNIYDLSLLQLRLMMTDNYQMKFILPEIA